MARNLIGSTLALLSKPIPVSSSSFASSSSSSSSSAVVVGLKRKFCDYNNSDSNSESDMDCTDRRGEDGLFEGAIGSRNGSILFTDGPKPGKKTKGRVKIKMEFIENKLRRYTTFSKRKTGIMKKAYELSTLTGTQVMLLVASETGHVYTFATRKLQPMITSESGKALIQTCLNSPDSPLDGIQVSSASDQRMNPSGYEETELSYAVSDDELNCLTTTTSPSSSSSPNKKIDSSTKQTTPQISSVNRNHQTPFSSSSTPSSSQSRLLYQTSHDVPFSQFTLCHPATSSSSLSSMPSSSTIFSSLNQTEFHLKQETLSSIINNVSKSRDNEFSQSRLNEGHRGNESHKKTATVVSFSKVKDSSPSSSSSSSSSSSVVLPSLTDHFSLLASAARHNSTRQSQLQQEQQQQQQHQQHQAFYKIPGTNQIISVSFTGACNQSAAQGATPTATVAQITTSGATTPSIQFMNLPQTAGSYETKASGSTLQFGAVSMPTSLTQATKSSTQPLFTHSTTTTSIKSELLPTDLRFNRN